MRLNALLILIGFMVLVDGCSQSTMNTEVKNESVNEVKTLEEIVGSENQSLNQLQSNECETEHVKDFALDNYDYHTVIEEDVHKVDYLGEHNWDYYYYKDYLSKYVDIQGKLKKCSDDIYEVLPMYGSTNSCKIYIRTSDIKSIDNETYLDSIYNIGVQYAKAEGMLVRGINFTRHCKVRGILAQGESGNKKQLLIEDAEIYFDGIEYDYEISVDELYNELCGALVDLESKNMDKLSESGLNKYDCKWVRIHGDIKEYKAGDISYRRGDSYRISDYAEYSGYGYTKKFYIDIQDEAICNRVFQEGDDIDIIGFCTVGETYMNANIISIYYDSGLGY